jgi:hypothetical protein
MTDDIYDKPTHLDAIREAWHEFGCGVREGFWELSDGKDEGGRGLSAPIALLCAPWGPLAYRFTPYNLERLFRPQKAERRQRLYDLNQYVFICGASEWTEDRWVEVRALLAEFGGEIGVDFPSPDWEPYSAAEMVGVGMGYTREEVAEIVSR